MNSNETNQPLISVIVPVYNIIPYLPRCVESLQKQTYPELEILLIDDGSTDDTPALCDRLAENDPRIRVFHKENGGPSSARNFGLTQAAGAYVGFVDSDDYVDADMYERLYRAIATTQMPIAQVGRDEIDQDGNILPNICEPVSEEQVIPAEDFLKELLMHRGDCSFCTKLVEASLLKEHHFPEGELNEDFRLLVELLPKIPAIGILPEQEYHVFYRYGSNTRTRDREEFPRVFTDIVNNADRVEALVKEQYPGLTVEAERFALIQRLDYMLHIPISQMKRDNTFYMQVCGYLKSHRKEIKTNPYLTKKNRQYLLLLAAAPAFVRKVHAGIRGFH